MAASAKSAHEEPVIVPSGGGLGADMRGADLRRLGDEAFAAVHRAWLHNLVLRVLGQNQRVAIARAVLRRPRLLLLDEPTSALDVSVQAGILNLLNRLQAAHAMTTVLVSHVAGVIAHMCDRAALLEDGQILRELDRTQLEQQRT